MESKINFDNPASITISGATLFGEPINKFPDEIKINKLDKGFLVQVGCKKLSFDSIKELFSAMDLYYKSPEKAEEKYLNTKKEKK